MTSISGKRILLVVPKFAPLDSQIMNELEIQGAYVEIIMINVKNSILILSNHL